MKLKYFAGIITILLIICALLLIAINISLKATEDISSPTPQAQVVEEDVATIVKLALVQKYGENSKNLEVSVTQNLGDYAKGMVSDPAGGGGMWFAAKRGSNWELVWDGNGIITCEDVADYPDFPSSLIPACFDGAKQTLINR